VRGFSTVTSGCGSSSGRHHRNTAFSPVSIISGQVFIDRRHHLRGTQSNVQGNPGGLLNKQAVASSVAPA